jgi:putative transposase
MRRGQKTSAEQVVLKLRQIEVQTAQGKSLAFRLAWEAQ